MGGETTNRYELRKSLLAYVESELECLLEDARDEVLNDPKLTFDAPPALTLDVYITRVLELSKK